MNEQLPNPDERREPSLEEVEAFRSLCSKISRQGSRAAPGNFIYLALLPDGRKVVISFLSESNDQVYIQITESKDSDKFKRTVYRLEADNKVTKNISEDSRSEADTFYEEFGSAQEAGDKKTVKRLLGEEAEKDAKRRNAEDEAKEMGATLLTASELKELSEMIQ